MKDLADVKLTCPVCGSENTLHVHAADVRLLTLTNYDRIISKSPEGLADQFTQNGVFLCPAHNPNCLEADCRECFLDWLKQEASDD